MHARLAGATSAPCFREPALQILNAAFHECPIATDWQIADARTGFVCSCLRVSQVAGGETRVAEIEVERRSELQNPVIGNGLGMLRCEGVPVESTLDSRLVAREEMRCDACIIVIATCFPGLLEKSPSSARITLDRHTRSAESHHGVVRINAHQAKMRSAAIRVFNNTFAPFVMSAGRENSFGAWLMPPMLGTKIMPIGAS